MNNVEQEKTGAITMERYKILINIITRTEDRLRLLDFAYVSLNIVILLFVITFISHLIRQINYILTYMDYALIYLIILTGISINVYWIAFVMRIQLKLKLRYFQARSVERKFNTSENIFSDEDIFFDPAVRRLESADGKETLEFPTKGFTRMDGALGALKPRHFSWLLPSCFIAIYWVVFILLITTV